MTDSKTWKQLKAEGVRRCCAMFTDGRQCRRRASESFEWSWCDKHGPRMKAEIAAAAQAIVQQAEADSMGSPAEDEESEDLLRSPYRG